MSFGSLLSGSILSPKLQEIIKNPNDLKLRELYADELISKGDTYGDFIYASMIGDNEEAKKLLTVGMVESHFSCISGLSNYTDIHKFREAIDDGLIVNGFFEKIHVLPYEWLSNFKQIISNNPIKYLFLEEFKSINFSHSLKDSFRRLEFLSLEYALLGAANLKRLIDSFKHISKLNLGFNLLISSDIQVLADKLEKPIYLDLHDNYFGSDGCRIIADSFKSLEYLNVNNCHSSAYFGTGESKERSAIEDIDIKELVFKLSNLKSLHVRNLYDLTDESVRYIVEALPNLESLSISSANITINSVRLIANGLKNLRELDFMGENMFDNQYEVSALFRGMPFYSKNTFKF